MDAKDAKADLQMGRTEKRKAKIKIECRSEKTGKSKGSTARSEGGKRRN